MPAGTVSANCPSDEKLRSRAYGVHDGVVGWKMRCAPACTQARHGSGDALSGSWTRTDNVPVSAPIAPLTMTQRAARRTSCSQDLCIRTSLPDESVPAKDRLGTRVLPAARRDLSARRAGRDRPVEEEAVLSPNGVGATPVPRYNDGPLSTRQESKRVRGAGTGPRACPDHWAPRRVVPSGRGQPRGLPLRLF